MLPPEIEKAELSGQRTHKQRLAKLREVFGSRKTIAQNSGKKHDVSITKICAEAAVDKVYLYGHRLKENDQNRLDYLALKEEILEFQKNLGKSIEQSENHKKFEELNFKYKALLGDIEPLQRELAYLRSSSNMDRDKLEYDRERITELLARNADLENKLAISPKQSNIAGNLLGRVQKHVLYPEGPRSYSGTNPHKSQKSKAQIWGNAFLNLEQLLSRKLKMRLFVLVGMPFSGKSTWAEAINLGNDRHPVIWNATNLTSMERYKFIISLSRFQDVPKTCVYFDTDMAVIRQRNLTLLNSDNQYSEDELSEMKNSLDLPDPYKEEWIDELIVVRNKHE